MLPIIITALNLWILFAAVSMYGSASFLAHCADYPGQQIYYRFQIPKVANEKKK